MCAVIGKCKHLLLITRSVVESFGVLFEVILARVTVSSIATDTGLYHTYENVLLTLSLLLLSFSRTRGENVRAGGNKGNTFLHVPVIFPDLCLILRMLLSTPPCHKSEAQTLRPVRVLSFRRIVHQRPRGALLGWYQNRNTLFFINVTNQTAHRTSPCIHISHQGVP